MGIELGRPGVTSLARARSHSWLATFVARGARRELLIVLASQAIASGGNFLAALFAARVSDPAAFGPIAILLAFYAVAVQLCRPFSGNVMQIEVARGPHATRELARGLLLLSLVAGIVVTIAFLPVGWLLFDVQQRTRLLAAAGMMPLLVLYDTLRLWWLSVQRPDRALAMDAVWLMMLIVGIVLLSNGHYGASGADLIVVWAGSGAFVAVSVAVAAFCARDISPDVGLAWSAALRIGRVYLVEAVTSAVYNTGFVLILASVVAVSTIGRLRALEMPFGLLATAGMGLTMFLQPTTRRLAARGAEERAWRITLLAGLSLVIGSAVLGIAALVLPQHVVRSIFGPSFRPGLWIVSAIVLKYASFGPILVMSTMSRSLGYRRATLPLVVASTLVATLLGLATATLSVAVSYLAVYAVISVGALVVIRRIRHVAFSPGTV